MYLGFRLSLPTYLEKKLINSDLKLYTRTFFTVTVEFMHVASVYEGPHFSTGVDATYWYLIVFADVSYFTLFG